MFLMNFNGHIHCGECDRNSLELVCMQNNTTKQFGLNCYVTVHAWCNQPWIQLEKLQRQKSRSTATRHTEAV